MSAPDRPAGRATPAPSLRRYSDQEVSLILRRAAELQVDQPGASTGTSLADLEAIAREAGLDPALVRRAAADLATAAPVAAPSRFLGAATRVHVERVIDGEVSGDDLEALVDEVRRTFGEPGIVSALGRTVTWSPTPMQYGSKNAGRRVFVTLTARGGQTTLRAEEDLSPLAGGLFGGLMGGMGGGLTAPVVAIGVGTFHAALPIVGLVGALVGGTYALSRAIYVTMARGRERALRQLIERLGAYAARAVAP
ncbi:hypothetical protein tb265_10390 [Gemmatimonadetes bacterium T265]|nr:hypothetical protein tb265_10390 [Gemmatimonadetes bacterium T265]